MRVTFQGDANLDARIVCGLKRRLPEVDFRTAGAEEWQDRLVWIPL
jgi:hypothetical protein